jgi:hypothetical protein
VRKQGYACLRKNVEITQSLLSGVTKVRGAWCTERGPLTKWDLFEYTLTVLYRYLFIKLIYIKVKFISKKVSILMG